MTETKLKELLRKLIREEINNALPGLVTKTITETFLKRLINETVPGIDAQSLHEEEFVENTNNYQHFRNPALDEKVVQNKFSGMEQLFEGTAPIQASSTPSNLGETQQKFGEEGVPLSMLGKLGVKFPGVSQKQQKSSSNNSENEKSIILERRRKMLQSIISDKDS